MGVNVGVQVGTCVANVGAAVAFVGLDVGLLVGVGVGADVVGETVGADVGANVGVNIGAAVGASTHEEYRKLILPSLTHCLSPSWQSPNMHSPPATRKSTDLHEGSLSHSFWHVVMVKPVPTDFWS
jgi:hypothetical protein